MTINRVFNKKFIIFPVVIMVLVVTSIFAYLYIGNRRQKQNNDQAKTDVSSVIEKGCADGSYANLEDAYQKTSDNETKAKISGIIAQCASTQLDDTNKAIEWSKKASEDYRSIGNNEVADRYQRSVEQYESLKTTTEQIESENNKSSTGSLEEKGTD